MTERIVLDDFGGPPGQSAWEVVTDRVMGGRSQAVLERGADHLRLQGMVSLENNGGFVQMARDLPQAAGEAGWAGIGLRLRGDGQEWQCSLRIRGLSRPWQSYRQPFVAAPDWVDVTLPFAGFVPHRTDLPFDPAGLRRIGLIAIGTARAARLDLAAAWLWR